MQPPPLRGAHAGFAGNIVIKDIDREHFSEGNSCSKGELIACAKILPEPNELRWQTYLQSRRRIITLLGNARSVVAVKPVPWGKSRRTAERLDRDRPTDAEVLAFASKPAQTGRITRKEAKAHRCHGSTNVQTTPTGSLPSAGYCRTTRTEQGACLAS